MRADDPRWLSGSRQPLLERDSEGQTGDASGPTATRTPDGPPSTRSGPRAGSGLPGRSASELRPRGGASERWDGAAGAASGERGGGAAGGAEPLRGPAERAAWKGKEYCNPPQRRGQLARTHRRMRKALRRIQRKSQRQCGLYPLPDRRPEIWCQDSEDGEGGERWGSIRGVMLCSSPWACPICAPRIRAVRGEELKKLVAWHGAERTMMATFTVRHGAGDDLGKVRQGVANAYRRMTRGEPWQRFCRANGLEGSVRAMEVTFGWLNGFHPHLHQLLLVMGAAALWKWLPWLRERWRKAVIAEMGEEFAPSDERGVTLTTATDGTYLSKMGVAWMEITDAVMSKGAKNGNLQAWDVAALAIEELEAGEPGPYSQVWRQYAEGMVGARYLTWSHGLKAKAKVDEVSDDAAARREGEGAGTKLAEIPTEKWALVLAVPDGENWIIRCAVRGGQEMVDRQLEAWERDLMNSRKRRRRPRGQDRLWENEEGHPRARGSSRRASERGARRSSR